MSIHGSTFSDTALANVRFAFHSGHSPVERYGMSRWWFPLQHHLTYSLREAGHERPQSQLFLGGIF